MNYGYKKLSDEELSEIVNKTDEVLIVQNGVIKKTTVDDLVNASTLNSNLEIYRQTISAGNTESSWQIEGINENTAFSFYASIYGVSPTEVSVSGNTVTATWDAQDSDMEVGVRIDG